MATCRSMRASSRHSFAALGERTAPASVRQQGDRSRWLRTKAKDSRAATGVNHSRPRRHSGSSLVRRFAGGMFIALPRPTGTLGRLLRVHVAPCDRHIPISQYGYWIKDAFSTCARVPSGQCKEISWLMRLRPSAHNDYRSGGESWRARPSWMLRSGCWNAPTSMTSR